MNKLRFVFCVCFLISVTTCLASCGTGTNTITEYSLPTSFSIPQGITAGPDGNIWFAETHSNKIGRITPSGELTEYRVPAGSSPYGMAARPDGNIWFTEQLGNKIGRVNSSKQ